MTAIRNFDLPDGISDKITGTTSDSYEDALSWTCYGLAGKTISIKNTHSSNALKYKILTYIYPGGTSFTEVGETSLSAGSSAKHTIGYPCARVIVQVKSSTAGNAATYQIEYTGNRFAGVPSQLDIALSALRDAIRGANTKDFSTLEADAESILGQLDITLSSLRDALLDVILNNLIHNNATVNSTGQSDSLEIKGAKHIDVLIRVGSITGSPTIQFHVDVIEPTSGAVIRTYDGTSINAANTSDYITIDGLTLGTHVRVSWDGTLDASNYFSGVFCRIVAKR